MSLTLTLQILMFDVQKQMVVDIWESDDRRLLLRFLRSNTAIDKKAPWDFGSNITFSVYDVATMRNWDLKIAIPHGCKKARPCVDGIDFLVWDPNAAKVETPAETDSGEHDYTCHGPFSFGHGNAVCVHGWNTPHALSNREAQETDRLTNCGLLPARQQIEKVE